MGRKAIRDFAQGMLIKERTTLEGMKRALRKLKIQPLMPAAPRLSVDIEVNGNVEAEGSGSSSASSEGGL